LQWTTPLEVGDWFDGLAILAQLSLTVTCAIGFGGACMVAAAGHGRDEHFFAAITEVLGHGMITLYIGINCTLALVAYTAIRHSHLIIASIFVTLALATYMYFCYMMTGVYTALPLEYFHRPNMMRLNFRVMAPFNPALKPDVNEACAVEEAEKVRRLFKSD
jgi:D-alanyl-lipoteichoic acid acyltransferase DltB (MBOAT superfamily)